MCNKTDICSAFPPVWKAFRRHKALAVGTALFGILFIQQGIAQSTATITGTVTDTTGATIAGANIVIANDATAQQIPVETTKDGDFAVPNLAVGSYTVTTKRSGFSTDVERDVTLLTGQTINLRIALKPGASTQTVEVTAGREQIQTTTSDVQFTVDKTQMENLPLDGRNPFDLAALAPGATTTDASTIPGQQDNRGLSVNGYTATENNWTMDGATYNNLHFGSAPTLPNPDTLQEFTIQTGTFSAENRGGGAVIKLTTRSGTNKFHGTVFEFFRNTVLDAVNYFSTTPSIYQQNQFGGTLGGPVRRNSLFFFGSYQGTIQRGSPSPEPVTVPTAAERNGIFPNVIIDPATGNPFPNNTIPMPFDSIGAKVMQLYPVAANGGSTFYKPTDSNRNDNQYLGRVDYQLGRKDSLAARYFYDHNVLDHDEGTVPGLKAHNGFTNQTFLVSDIHTFSSTWILHAMFNYLRTYRHEIPVTPATMEQFGANVQPATSNVPPKILVSISGFTQLFSGRGLQFNPEVAEYAADVSHTVGNHFIRFGGSFRDDAEYNLNLGDELGHWSYAVTQTSSSKYKGSGNAFASLLVGKPSSFTQSSTAPENFVLKIFDVWVQDDWKITPKLTFNLGLRYEPWLPAHDSFGLESGFEAGVQSKIAPLVPQGLLFSGDPGIPPSVIRPHWNTFSPRIGFALDAFGNGSTVLRGGFGIFRQGTEFFNQLRTFVSATPTRTASITITAPPSTADPYANYKGTLPFPYTPTPPSALSTFTLPADSSLTVFDPNIKPEYSESYSLAVEQRLTPSSSVSFTYVGHHMVHGILTYDANPAVYGPGVTTKNEDSYRIHQGFSDIILGTSADYGNYNGLQVQYNYRSRRGLTVQANYAWAKALDISSSGEQGVTSAVGPSDPFNLAKDYAPADFDLRHQLKAAVIYQIPGYKGHAGFVRALSTGWHANLITVLQTGQPYTCRSGVDNSLSGVGLDHCDQIGPAQRPAGVSKMTEWINVASFTQNAIGTFGNMGRNSLRRPSKMNANLSLFRDFPIVERLTGQFRVEAFNVLNHPNFDLYNTAAGYVNSQVVTSATFGKLGVASDPRVIQFAMKLIF